jgi:hypothetical protein
MITSIRFARSALPLALGVAMLGTLGATSPANAQGAWCAYYSGPAGGTNCGFYTLGQCRAAVSGVGGQCSPSPYARYYGGGPRPYRKARRHYRY